MAKSKNRNFQSKKRNFQSDYTENYGRKRSQDDLYEEVLDDEEYFVDEKNPDSEKEDDEEDELRPENI